MSLIIGIAGPMASGKTTATTYLKETYHANTHRFSTMLRDVLDRMYIEKKRSNLQGLSTIIRQTYGEDTMAKVMAKDVENDTADVIVVEGIRRPDDAIYLVELPNFVLVSIDADEKIRYERLHTRDENADDQSKTFEEFQKEQEQESELKIKDVMKDAAVAIDNNGSLKDLYKNLDSIMTKYGSTY